MVRKRDVKHIEEKRELEKHKNWASLFELLSIRYIFKSWCKTKKHPKDFTNKVKKIYLKALIKQL